VLQIYEALKRRGLDPWIDQEALLPGESWLDGIEKSLQSSIVAVVFVGAHGLGRFEEKEVKIIIESDQRVIPALLPGGQESSVPRFLRSYQRIDFLAGTHEDKT